MALEIADRVKETTTTTSTGTYALAGAVDGFQSFAAVGDGNTTYYACTDGTDYEVGVGSYTASGTTLSRVTILESSNSDAAVNWGAGTKEIFVTVPAEKYLVRDASGNVSLTGNLTISGTVDGRDVSADGSKLDGIESGATADQTAAQIRAKVEAASDSNVFTDADHTKLNGLEANAKDDQTITAGSGLTGGGTGDVTLSHANTSSQASVNGSGRTYIQDITLDTYGHVTGLATATETVVNTDTVPNNATITISAGNALTGGGNFTTDQASNETITINHQDTSSQASVNNSGRTYIQDITLDGYGHITGISSATETVTNTNTNQLTTFQVEDGDGTEVTISHGKEWKFVEAGGININWTDTSTGSDGDPYDLSFNVSTSISAGGGLTGGGQLNANRTISHADTSSQSSVNNSGNTVIQDVTLDTYGHVTALTSKALSIPAAAHNATITIAAGTDLTTGGNFTTNQSSNETITINHADTSALSGTYGSTANGTKIDQITVDARGHVTAITTGATGTGSMSSFQLEDGDGTEVTINNGKEVKFVEGGGIDINWTDTSNGTDGDPYDLTFTHADTSSQASVNNSGRTYIQDITLDGYGHVTGITSATETVTNTDTIPANATITLSAGTNLSGGGNFTTNQSSNETITFNMSSTPSVTSLAIGSTVTLAESTDRADLLQITSSTSTWGGLQIRNSSNEGRWSFMTDGSTAGLYDDENGDWHMQMQENGGVTLYANGIANFTTGTTYMEMARHLDMNNYDIYGCDQIFHHGDTNTYMQFHAADQWRVVVGGTERLEVKNSSPHVLVTGDLNSTSDARLKENVEPIANALSDVTQLEGVSFDWKDTGTRGHGFIAQQVEPILPDVVNTDDKTGIKSINYVGMIGHLVEAIKELKAEIDELKR
jgi:hypothetical protein